MKIRYICAAVMALMLMVLAVGCEANAETRKEPADSQKSRSVSVSPAPSQHAIRPVSVSSESSSVRRQTSVSTSAKPKLAEETPEEDPAADVQDDCNECDDHDDYDEDWIDPYDYCEDNSSSAVIEYGVVDFDFETLYSDDDDVGMHFTIINYRNDAITSFGITVYDEYGDVIGCSTTDCLLGEHCEYDLELWMFDDLGIDQYDYDELYFRVFAEVGGTYYTHDTCDIYEF